MARKAAVEERPALTRERIVTAASDLIERDGIGAFTMRSLGRELGVSAMAVYSHFDSRDAILVAVLRRLMASMNTDPVPGETWDDTLRRTMTSIYQLEMAHPELATIEVVPQAGENGLAEHTDKIVNLHLAQGMPESVLTQAWALVDAYLTGFIGNAIAVRANRPSADCGVSNARAVEEGGSADCASDDEPPWATHRRRRLHRRGLRPWRRDHHPGHSRPGRSRSVRLAHARGVSRAAVGSSRRVFAGRSPHFS